MLHNIHIYETQDGTPIIIALDQRMYRCFVTKLQETIRAGNPKFCLNMEIEGYECENPV